MSTVYFEPDNFDVGIERASKLLAGIPGGVYHAVGAALIRAGKHGQTIGMKFATEEYAIGSTTLKQYTKTIYTVKKSTQQTHEVTFGYRGRLIPLIKFEHSVLKDGTVKAHSLRSTSKEVMNHAFIATVYGHTGIFEREGRERLPIKELFGPSAVQALEVHKETVDKMADEINKTFDVRIEHEITRILNGWGK